MNDRYLFKAKRKNWKELPKEEWWTIGHYVEADGIPYIYKLQGNEDAQRIYRIDESTLCQCTGVLDKRKNLIWENDIVKCGGQMFVSWNEKFASWCLTRKGWLYNHFFGESQEPEECEVVGNCFDNPELLEDKR